MLQSGWAEALEQSRSALWIQESLYAFPVLEVLHVISIGLVMGSIMLVDLRLMHAASLSYRLNRLMRSVLPVTIVAFFIALLSGSLMFVSQASHYLDNPPFLIKMGLIVVAGINMAVFHLWSHHKIGGWEVSRAPPLAARLAGLTSIILWVSVLVAGRTVGFF